MEETRLAVRVEHIPAHKYLGIWEEKANNYCDFWKYHDCDEVCGFVTGMENRAFSFNPTEMGYEWNEEECQIYQRHYPEKLGY